jgi:hypothetical protein
MACGLPVIVSDWGGYKDTVLHGETGFRIPTYWAEADEPFLKSASLFHSDWDHFHVGQSVAVDVPALADAMLTLLRNPSLRQQMGEAGRRHVESLYSWKRVIRLHEELWDELSAQAQSAPPSPPPQGLHLEPRYFQAFSGYAGRLLDGNTMIRLSPEGQAAAKQGLWRMPYSELQALLKTDVLTKTLQVMRNAGFLGVKGFRLDEIEETLAKQFKFDRQMARLHLLWLLKYGLLEVERKSL